MASEHAFMLSQHPFFKGLAPEAIELVAGFDAVNIFVMRMIRLIIFISCRMVMLRCRFHHLDAARAPF